MTAALERLESSRSRLREAMLPAPAKPSTSGATPPGSGAWLNRLKQFPAVSVVVDGFNAWWQNHPMRPIGKVAVQASDAVARPFARDHPIALVLIAAVVGAAFMRTRPWRWALRPALLAGLVPQVASRLAKHLPIESWVSMFGAALSRPRAGPSGPTPRAAARPTNTAAVA